jgi:hypothetical protein
MATTSTFDYLRASRIYGITSAGAEELAFTFDTDTIFVNNDLQINDFSVNIDGGRLTAATNATEGPHQFTVKAGGFVDNVVFYWNDSGGYSANVWIDPEGTIGDNGPALAIGIGPASATQGYAGNAYFAVNPPASSPTAAPGDFIFTVEREMSGNYLERERFRIGGGASNTDIVLRGLTAASRQGPRAVKIVADGTVTMGESGIAGGVVNIEGTVCVLNVRSRDGGVGFGLISTDANTLLFYSNTAGSVGSYSGVSNTWALPGVATAAAGLTVGSGSTVIAAIKSAVKSAHDFGTVNAGVTATTTLTVTGAAVDNPVAWSTPATWPNGLELSARCTAADTVTIYAFNPTAGNIATGSFNFRVTQIKY